VGKPLATPGRERRVVALSRLGSLTQGAGLKSQGRHGQRAIGELAPMPSKEFHRASDSYRSSKATGWRCGWDRHTTQDYYTHLTIKGTELPEAPKQASLVQGKRKREEGAQEAPAAQRTKAVHVKTEDKDMREAARVMLQQVWPEDSDF